MRSPRASDSNAVAMVMQALRPIFRRSAFRNMQMHDDHREGQVTLVLFEMAGM